MQPGKAQGLPCKRDQRLANNKSLDNTFESSFERTETNGGLS